MIFIGIVSFLVFMFYHFNYLVGFFTFNGLFPFILFLLLSTIFIISLDIIRTKSENYQQILFLFSSLSLELMLSPHWSKSSHNLFISLLSFFLRSVVFFLLQFLLFFPLIYFIEIFPCRYCRVLKLF